MAEGRVLISCRLVWDSVDAYVPDLEKLGFEVDIPRFEGQQLAEADLLPIIDRYDGILAGDDHLTRSVLERGKRLKVISKWGIGVDAIDVAAAEELGIQVINTPGVFGDELADYAMGFLLLMARHQHEVNERVKRGEWHKVQGFSLAGKTLGIVGLGSSGRALARRAVAASMRVIGYDIAAVPDNEAYEVVDLDDLLRKADVVSLHLPLTPETAHLINEKTLNLMKPGVWLINTSRGALVDEKALIEALENGRVAQAGLDVFEAEPVPPDNPLLGFDNVIVGSHNGSNTREAVNRVTKLAFENLVSALPRRRRDG
jgi:D-3-phosphoglycerate dehydrogenase / 2-oxoglutarate reductase